MSKGDRVQVQVASGEYTCNVMVSVTTQPLLKSFDTGLQSRSVHAHQGLGMKSDVGRLSN